MEARHGVDPRHRNFKGSAACRCCAPHGSQPRCRSLPVELQRLACPAGAVGYLVLLAAIRTGDLPLTRRLLWPTELQELETGAMDADRTRQVARSQRAVFTSSPPSPSPWSSAPVSRRALNGFAAHRVRLLARGTVWHRRKVLPPLAPDLESAAHADARLHIGSSQRDRTSLILG